jgi:hypothetical protein
MPIYLSAIRSRLLLRLHGLNNAFERHLVVRKLTFRTDRFAIQEGLISQLWQSWNLFCRDVVIASSQGALTTGGASTSSIYAHLSDSELAFVARKYSRREPVSTFAPLGKHLEPTWGDFSKLNLIISGLRSTNDSKLLTSFGVAVSINDLQLCRNACAHLNKDSVAKIGSSRVRYNETAFSHPSDFMFWIAPTTGDFVWRYWLEEMELISEFAVE